MHEFICYNSEFIAQHQLSFSFLSNSFLYGKGIFTTLAVYNSKPFLFDLHWKRLLSNAGKINLDLSSFSKKNLETLIFHLIEKNKIADGRVRVTFFDESESKVWSNNPKNKISFLISSAEKKNLAESFKITISPFSINSKSPIAGIKSSNYLENILAFEDAKKKKFDEAIRLNEKNEVVSATMANIFWTKDEKIFTPAIETGCLAGTTRELLIKIAKELNLNCLEGNFSIEDLSSADEIFLTSSGIGIMPAMFENKKMRTEITSILKDRFEIYTKTIQTK